MHTITSLVLIEIGEMAPQKTYLGLFWDGAWQGRLSFKLSYIPYAAPQMEEILASLS